MPPKPTVNVDEMMAWLNDDGEPRGQEASKKLPPQSSKPTQEAQEVPVRINWHDALSIKTEADALFKEGKHREAIARYKEALAQDSSMSEAWGNLSIALRMKGQFTESLSAARRAVEETQTKPTATLLAAKALQRLVEALLFNRQYDACERAVVEQLLVLPSSDCAAIQKQVSDELLPIARHMKCRAEIAHNLQTLCREERVKRSTSDLVYSRLITVALPGLGRTLQATEDIPRGAIVLVDVPWLTFSVPDPDRPLSNDTEEEWRIEAFERLLKHPERNSLMRHFYGPGEEECTFLKSQTAQPLSASQRETQQVYTALWDKVSSRHRSIDPKEETVFSCDGFIQFCRIMDSNALGHPDLGVASLFPLAAMAQHSCDPSCCYTTLPSGECIFIARRSIRSGESVSISYIDPFQSKEQRQSALQSKYCFSCDCALCCGRVPERGRSFDCPHCFGHSLPENNTIQSFRCVDCGSEMSEEVSRRFIALERHPHYGLSTSPLEVNVHDLRASFFSPAHHFVWRAVAAQSREAVRRGMFEIGLRLLSTSVSGLAFVHSALPFHPPSKMKPLLEVYDDYLTNISTKDEEDALVAEVAARPAKSDGERALEFSVGDVSQQLLQVLIQLSQLSLTVRREGPGALPRRSFEALVSEDVGPTSISEISPKLFQELTLATAEALCSDASLEQSSACLLDLVKRDGIERSGLGANPFLLDAFPAYRFPLDVRQSQVKRALMQVQLV